MRISGELAYVLQMPRSRREATSAINRDVAKISEVALTAMSLSAAPLLPRGEMAVEIVAGSLH